MSERGPVQGDSGLQARLDRLLQEYSAKLDKLELTLPAVGAPPEPPPPYLTKNYFPDESEPPTAPAPPPVEAAPAIVEAPTPEPEPAKAPERPAPVARPLEAEPVPAQAGPVARPLERRAPSRAAEKALSAGLALAAVLAAFGLWRAAEYLAQAPHRFFPLQGRALAGLAGDGASLFADDGGRLLEIAADGRVRPAGMLSGGPVIGLALDDAGHFWTSVEGQARLYEHDTDPARSVRKAYPYPNRSFSQVALAGDTLWALDGATGAAYEYMLSRSLLGTSLTPISQFEGGAETARAAGLTVAQGLLWVCDPAQRRVLRFRAEGSRLAPVDALDLSPWVAPGTRVTGMTLAGGYLWVLTGWPGGLHRLRLDGLSWQKP